MRLENVELVMDGNAAGRLNDRKEAQDRKGSTPFSLFAMQAYLPRQVFNIGEYVITEITHLHPDSSTPPPFPCTCKLSQFTM